MNLTADMGHRLCLMFLVSYMFTDKEWLVNYRCLIIALFGLEIFIAKPLVMYHFVHYHIK